MRLKEAEIFTRKKVAGEEIPKRDNGVEQGSDCEPAECPSPPYCDC